MKKEFICICPECGEEMFCKSHFCENCKERVAVPVDLGEKIILKIEQQKVKEIKENLIKIAHRVDYEGITYIDFEEVKWNEFWKKV